MNVEIKKLTPAHVEEYINFFETTPHDDNIPEHTCYCECWCSADHRFGTGIPSREERKAMAIEYVKSGKIQGYLAYFDGGIVGWCNANTKTECLNCIGWYRFMPQVNELEIDANDKVKSIYCFLVAPDMKRKGIAKQLLKYACQDAMNDGYDYVEVYPEKETTDERKYFMGFLDMYKNFGFTIHAETKQKFVMRKQLNYEQLIYEKSAFYYKKIDETDLKLLRYNDIKQLNNNDFRDEDIVNKDKDMLLIALGGGSFEIPASYSLVYEGQKISIECGGGGKQARRYIHDEDGSCNVEIIISSVFVPSYLLSNVDDITLNIADAFAIYGFNHTSNLNRLTVMFSNERVLKFWK